MPLPRAIAANPFYQPARQWQIRVNILKDQTDAVEEAFADIALSMSSFEATEDGELWHTDILTECAPDDADIPSRLALVSGLLDIPTPTCDVQELNPRDWVSEVERSFPPLSIGRFYVYGSHVSDPVPSGKMGLKVNAGAAFGSGEHATTSGCLLALSMLAKEKDFRKPLDVGCGSGILALAMASLWKVPVLGTDIDPISVATSRENAQINRLTRLTRFEVAEGYNHNVLRRGAPYDLITANILAKPLCRMAPDLANSLASGGIAILSGLLATQERMVLSAHQAQGLTLIRRIRRSGWNTLLLRNVRN